MEKFQELFVSALVAGLFDRKQQLDYQGQPTEQPSLIEQVAGRTLHGPEIQNFVKTIALELIEQPEYKQKIIDSVIEHLRNRVEQGYLSQLAGTSDSYYQGTFDAAISRVLADRAAEITKEFVLSDNALREKVERIADGSTYDLTIRVSVDVKQ